MIYSALFTKVVNKLIELEGGYSDDKNDPGGRTKYGITSKLYTKVRKPDWPIDVASITPDIAKEIYWTEFWIKPEICTLPSEMAAHTFIAGVNIGPERAIRFIQASIGGIVQDGIIGDKTFSAANIAIISDRTEEIICSFCGYLLRYYNSLPTRQYYYNGWFNRVLRTIRFCGSL